MLWLFGYITVNALFLKQQILPPKLALLKRFLDFNRLNLGKGAGVVSDVTDAVMILESLDDDDAKDSNSIASGLFRNPDANFYNKHKKGYFYDKM